ncbi:MAG: enoyl-CoA hydratase [Lawsonella sp.]
MDTTVEFRVDGKETNPDGTKRPILVEIFSDAKIAKLTLRIPEHRNALNAELCRGIQLAVERCSHEGVRSLVITGAGEAFCAGADLTGGVFSSGFANQNIAMLRTLERAKMIIIAYVNGAAIGSGAQLAMACDLRVASEDAYFALPVVKMGFALDNWSIRRLESLVGGGFARGILYTGDLFSAQDSAKHGLVNKLGDSNDALAWAQEIATYAPLTLNHLKQVFNNDLAQEKPTPMQAAAAKTAWISEDLKEARRAYVEGRRPQFRGI